MQASKRPRRDQEKAWSKAKSAVHEYARNPCAATEVAVSEALGKVRELSDCVPAAQKRPADKAKR